MRIAVPDLISPSYFPAIVAVELGFAADAGLDLDLELRFPVTDAAQALRDGTIDFLAGAAHAPGYLPDGWHDIVLLGALSQRMYWFLVAHADLAVPRGDLHALHDMRIGAAPGPDLGLVEMLHAAGVDTTDAGIDIVPVRGADKDNVSFGVTAAHELQARHIDAFWANGMGAEVAVTQGYGTLVVDARRGDGPPGSEHYTFAALMTRRSLVESSPDAAAAATTALRRAQQALAANPALATPIGQKLFPAMEASLIANQVARDAPYYSSAISPESLDRLNTFISHRGLTPIGPRAMKVSQF